MTRKSWSRRRRSELVIWSMSLGAATGGALAGCHPTGDPTLDPLYTALLAGTLTFAASRSSRAPLLVMTTAGVVLSKGWLWLPAAAGLGTAFTTAFMRRAHRRINALIGALGVQVLLRWPHIGTQGLTAALALAAATPVVFSAWRHRRARVGNKPLALGGAILGLGILLSVPVVLSALSARSSVTQAIQETHQALADVGNSDPTSTVDDLSRASRALGYAHSRMDAWWDLGGYLVPFVAQQERAMDRLTNVGWRLTASAAGEAGSIDFHDLRYRDGQVDIAAIEALRGPVSSLDRQVAQAQSELQQVDSPWLVSPIASRTRHLATQLSKARRETGLAALAVQDVPSLLGVGGARHYLVAFVTPSETRGLDGFIGAYGVLNVDHGRVTLGQTGRANQLIDSASTKYKLTGPASYLARYGGFHPEKYFEDLTYSPDFPSDAQAMAQLFPQITGIPVDGVLAVDPYTLAALLRFTGPIDIPGLPYQLTSANAADVLLRQQYLGASANTLQRHDFLQEAMAVGFGRLASGSLPSPKDLSNVLDPLVRSGRLLFWSAHPDDNQLLNRTSMDGSFPRSDGGDLLAVTVANAANNKIDDYLRESLTDHVRYDPATGAVQAHVTVTLRNTAPSSGMPAYVIGSFANSGLPSGTNYMWLSFYSPLSLTGSTLNGRPITFSGAVDEAGSPAYSAFVTVPAMSTATLSLDLSGTIQRGSKYRLTTWLQPLAVPPTMTVSASRQDGRGGATWSAGGNEIERHAWKFADT